VELVFRLNLIPQLLQNESSKTPRPAGAEYKSVQTFLPATCPWHTFPLPRLPPGRESAWLDDGAEDKLLRGRWRDWCRLRRSGSGHGRETEASKRRDFPLRVVKTPSAKHVPELSSSPSAAGTCTFRIPSLFLRYPMQSVPKLTSAPVASTPGPWTQASNSGPPLIRYRFQLRRPMTFEPSACKPPAACSGRRTIAGNSQAPTL
jgi:hypothetical protein